jgi:hypothetical protein
MNRSRRAAVAVGIAVASLLSGLAFAQSVPQTTVDGLEKIDSRRVDTLYWRPGASLGNYKRVMIAEPTVAFRKNWQRDQNRGRGLSEQVSAKDMERIRDTLAQEFLEQFKAELQDKNGYEVVNTVGDDVLLLRPAIVELDVAAPDIPSASRTRNYVTSAGEMTLSVELFDSATNELIGRAIDRREARRMGGTFQVANRITNLGEARVILRQWAAILRRALDDQWSAGR